MLSRNNICYNLEKTPYKLSLKYGEQEVTYHFSSKLYKTKFTERREENRITIEASLSKRFGFNFKGELIADLRLYSSIEKRGFLISVNGEYKQWLSSITLDGPKVIVNN